MLFSDFKCRRSSDKFFVDAIKDSGGSKNMKWPVTFASFVSRTGDKGNS